LILALAAVGGGVSLFGKKSALHRFLAIYTLALTLIYCVISYKTPWCLLGFFHGMILLAGVGAAALMDVLPRRSLKICFVTILVALTAQLIWQTGRASFTFAADRRNPYVYAQTVPDMLNLVNRAEGIARVAPDGYDTVVKVIAPESDYWPLPWYLRRFNHVGWYDQLPADPLSPIVIVSSKLGARLDDLSDKKWIMTGYSELRPGTFLEMYVELELWKRYVETLAREEG
jgi:predicted membrane-bound mannosyltransferase